MEEILVILGVAVFLGPLIIAVVAIAATQRNRRRLAEFDGSLRDWARDVDASLAELRRRLARLEGTAPEPEAEAPPVQSVSEFPVVADAGVAATPAPEEEAAPAAPEAPPPPVTAPGAGAAGGMGAFEQALASRWLVWLGAVAIALGGTFLVKYMIDQGWMGPLVRVAAGFVLGIGLAGAGEVLRRKPLQRAIATIGPDYVPPALTASGLFIAFASIYAAYALYGLIAPVIAFAGLAVVALLAVGLSILHGWFVALMGLVGAFLTPALVSVERPSAWTLFAYLLVIEAACLAVARREQRWGLAFAALGGATVWPLIWLAVSPTGNGIVPLGLYLVVMTGLFLAAARGRHRLDAVASRWGEIAKLSAPEWIGWAAAFLGAALLVLLVRDSGYAVAALVFLGLFAALVLGLGRAIPFYDGLAVIAAVAGLAALASWPLPETVTLPRPLFQLGGRAIGTEAGTPLVPPELGLFATASVAFGALFGISGFAALWGAARPALWAAVSAAVPALVLAIAYWRISDFGIDLGWAVVALGLAVVALGAAARIEQYRVAQSLAASLGFYAAATVAFISLGATMALQQAWLTVALSVQLPALAWIHRRIPVRPIAVVAAVIAAVVLVRLVFNYNVLDYAPAASPLTSWVVYGYGIPAVLFFLAARLFRDAEPKLLATLLQAGGLVFSVLLVSLEIRLLVTGSLVAPVYGLAEQSLQTISWLALGLGLAQHHARTGHRVSFYGARILVAVACAQVVILQLAVSNPLITHAPVGELAIVDVLLLAYAVPAVFAFVFARGDYFPPALARGLAGLGFVLAFVYVTLEVTHAFHGAVLRAIPQSDGEFYAYSVAWLVFALILLGLGIRSGRSLLRYASLAVLLITVIKVFLFDMGDLTGLYRVASFLGLGLSLVGIGYLYQRFVFRAAASGPVGPAP